MKTILSIILVAAAITVDAGSIYIPRGHNPDQLMRYWVRRNGHPEITHNSDRDHLWKQSDDVSTNGIKITSSVLSLPSPTELMALSSVAATESEQKESDHGAPDTGWENISRRERFLIRCIYRLAKEHWPTLTLEQFRAQLRTEWDESE